MAVEYKGYKIVQAENNHIGIMKDGCGVAHIQVDSKLSEDELKSTVEWFIKFVKKENS